MKFEKLNYQQNEPSPSSGVRRRSMEAEAAAEVGQILHREFGLSPTTARAELCGSILQVTLESAVSPLGRAIADAEGGEEALTAVYALLHSVNQERLHCAVSRILGIGVRQSQIAFEFLPAWNVFVTFQLEESSGKLPYDQFHVRDGD